MYSDYLFFSYYICLSRMWIAGGENFDENFMRGCEGWNREDTSPQFHMLSIQDLFTF